MIASRAKPTHPLSKALVALTCKALDRSMYGQSLLPGLAPHPPSPQPTNQPANPTQPNPPSESISSTRRAVSTSATRHFVFASWACVTSVHAVFMAPFRMRRLILWVMLWVICGSHHCCDTGPGGEDEVACVVSANTDATPQYNAAAAHRFRVPHMHTHLLVSHSCVVAPAAMHAHRDVVPHRVRCQSCTAGGAVCMLQRKHQKALQGTTRGGMAVHVNAYQTVTNYPQPLYQASHERHQCTPHGVSCGSAIWYATLCATYMRGQLSTDGAVGVGVPS